MEAIVRARQRFVNAWAPADVVDRGPATGCVLPARAVGSIIEPVRPVASDAPEVPEHVPENADRPNA